VLARLAAAHPNDVRLVYRHFPLSFHDKARLAAQAAEAAGLQGKFWEMHELLYAKFPEWRNTQPDDFRRMLNDYATEVGLDTARFAADLESDAVIARVEAAYRSATTIGGTGLPGTPFLVINDQPLDQNIRLEFWILDAIVKLELLKDRQFQRPEDVLDPLKSYTATLKTEKGDIVVQLFAEQAPVTVNNFVFLARQGWYDGVTFHRVLPGFVVQGGDPTGTGFGGPGYYIPNEIVPELIFDAEGLVAMANSGPDTNGSQFFITLGPAPNLNGKYTIFGKVTAGMDVVRALAPRDPQANPEAPPGDKIISVIIEEK
jgi:cyclophilin family peptidyl-prolyl cis-trans isomerase